jgi:hypothetical protein
LGLIAALVGCSNKGSGMADIGPAWDIWAQDRGVVDRSAGDRSAGDLLVPHDTWLPDSPVVDPSWVVFGGSNAGTANAWDIFVDSAGNSDVGGAFNGLINFGSKALSAGSFYVPMAARLDPSGKVLWAEQLTAGAAHGSVSGIFADSGGNTYVGGQFQGTQTFGSTTLKSAGFRDGFVARLNPSGKVIWAVAFGGPEEDVAHNLAVDSSGNSYILGSFKATAVFGSTTITSKGKTDLCIVKVDPSGKVLWVISGGGSGVDLADDIALDNAGNIFVAGSILGPANFGSIKITPQSAEAAIVAKLDPSGKFLWVSQAHGSSILTQGVAVDSKGNSYVTGAFQGTAVFGSTTLTKPMQPKWPYAYVAKRDPSGTFLWAAAGGATIPNDIALDNAGNTYITGSFVNSTTFGSTSLTPAGWSDILVAKLDGKGKWLGAVSAGGKLSETGKAIGVDSSGNAYVTGIVLQDPLDPYSLSKDTVTFGKTSYTLDGLPHMYVWKVPASAL